MLYFVRVQKFMPSCKCCKVQLLNSKTRLSTEEQARKALCHLNHRECELGGYQLVMLPFHSGTELINAVAYIATAENQLYVENESMLATAQIIARLLEFAFYSVFVKL